MQWLYGIVIGFVAASLVTTVYHFEPNRVLARGLIFMIYLTGTLAIWAKIR
jgi:membrane protease YdiL (CAAX protease family)